jgi:processive 1,2-diacylglycerol beta-glucosyltransferase
MTVAAMTIRALLLYSPAGGGHRVAAHAVAASIRLLAPDADVEVRDVLDFAPRWFRYDQIWAWIQRHAAAGWDWCFDATDTADPLGLERLRQPVHRALLAELDRYLVARAPTHVISTHYLPAIAVGRQRRRGVLGARTLTVVTDHRVHHGWVTGGVDGYAVADPAAARALARRAPDVAIEVTGIPIARACGRPVVAVPHLTDVPRVLTLLGGLPPATARAALTSLAPLARAGRVALRVLTGDDPEVLRAARAALAGTGADVADRRPDLQAALDDADVVVTKAGGLIVSECLARGRAMVLPFAAPGQERGNRDHALDVGAAVRPHELADLGVTLASVAGEPGRLRRMSARARMAARPDAADAVAAFALADRLHDRRRVA